MRVLRLSFSSAKDFLTHFSEDVPEGLVFCWGRVDLAPNTDVLAEIDFPELPNQMLVRATVQAVGADKGAWLRFADDDRSSVPFMLGIARGELEISETTPRRHERYPSGARTTISVAEKPAQVGTAEDVSAGGAFVRMDQPPAVGTMVRLEMEAESGELVEITGEVAWVRGAHLSDPGVGIRFDSAHEEDERLKSLLRRAQEARAVDSLPN